MALMYLKMQSTRGIPVEFDGKTSSAGEAMHGQTGSFKGHAGRSTDEVGGYISPCFMTFWMTPWHFHRQKQRCRVESPPIEIE